ncbi:hypothetical protein M3650_02785 [Paenibacillus sp. MER TA 81-3]|uniref:hypothetical protein n=1 Tax=Paenibacillus sp. MER TA 81-3 TaxID=2939573 RepID=UPI0020421182|nr:hypothetical protein [Paenibacillus sp. MER TA 81-3]MCM3337596.1 hypothetical protein [Paenibacillus sp. MER TA 81-3]
MLKVLIHQLIPVERMEYMSAEELIEHVCLQMYNPEAAPLRERESFDKLPAR